MIRMIVGWTMIGCVDGWMDYDWMCDGLVRARS